MCTHLSAAVVGTFSLVLRSQEIFFGMEVGDVRVHMLKHLQDVGIRRELVEAIASVPVQALALSIFAAAAKKYAGMAKRRPDPLPAGALPVPAGIHDKPPSSPVAFVDYSCAETGEVEPAKRARRPARSLRRYVPGSPTVAQCRAVHKAAAKAARRKKRPDVKVTRVSNERWTAAEDAKLMELVQRHGKKWSKIGAEMPAGKGDGRKCSQRYRRFLSPSINHKPWELDEVVALFDAVAVHGTANWTKVANAVNSGRPDSSCRHVYCSLTLQRQSRDVKVVPLDDNIRSRHANIRKKSNRSHK